MSGRAPSLSAVKFIAYRPRRRYREAQTSLASWNPSGADLFAMARAPVRQSGGLFDKSTLQCINLARILQPDDSIRLERRAEEAMMAKTTAKTAAKKPADAKAPAKKAGGAGLQKPVQPSKELAAIVGETPLPRTEVISKVWDHIRKHNLQNPQNKREIIADDKLKAVFGQDKATMFEMNKLLSPHLK
jgi:upstream activation factor subunit UAF30